MTEFLLQKPWYARTKHDTDTDADADSNVEGAEPVGKSVSFSALRLDKWLEDQGFWIPQTTPDGKLFYRNTHTEVSRPELPPKEFGLSDRTPDWETEAIDSSQLPYADREDISKDGFNAMVEELARIDDHEGGDIDATLAKLEGQYPRIQDGSSEWQAMCAAIDRKKAAVPYTSSDLDWIFKVAKHVRVEARVEAKRDRWQRVRSIGRLFERQASKSSTTPLKEAFERKAP